MWGISRVEPPRTSQGQGSLSSSRSRSQAGWGAAIGPRLALALPGASTDFSPGLLVAQEQILTPVG